jgi:predicted NBD/HSP70 family sugar kinase
VAVLQRQYGRRELLHRIRRAERIPRIALAEQTGISRATVTTITAELLQNGLIEETVGPDTGPENRRGRPRVDLKIRGDAHLVAGGKITNRKLSLVLLDFEGTQLSALETELAAESLDCADLADAIALALQDLARGANRAFDEISGVGLGIAGIVQASESFVYWSPSLTERNVEFGPILSRRLGRPVFVDNDANLVAVAEKTFGLGKGHSDFIVVTLESGVGMGLYINGELYRGTRGCGAELGHTKVSLNGAVCRCGQRGCLEAYVADYALIQQAACLPGVDPTAPGPARMASLLAAARRGDAKASDILDRAGRIFALGLANLVNIFDPELIILAGEQMQFDHLYADEVIAAMRQCIVQIDKAPPEVVIHKWGNLMWARGAAAYALDQVSEMALVGLDNAAD